MCRHAANELCGSVGSKHRAHGQAEVADDTATSRGDERPRGVHALRCERVAAKPPVEHVASRVEGADVVVGVEPFEQHSLGAAHASRSFGVFLNRSTNSGTGWAGLSSSAMKRSKAWFDSTKSLCCLTTPFARAVTVSSTNAVTVVSSRSAA